MLIIANRRCIAFGGETRSGRLTLRVAREATVRPAFGIFETVKSGGNDGARPFAAPVGPKTTTDRAITEAIAVIENYLHVEVSIATWMPTLNMEIGDRGGDYKERNLRYLTRTNGRTPVIGDPKGALMRSVLVGVRRALKKILMG
jgi:hypothetical protein